MIKTTGKEKNYELIEYISDVNTQYTQVLMELNENGAVDAAYTYGVSRLTEDRFTGESNFYLYDPAGNVAGITDQDGYLWQSYRYDAFGNATFGSPQYDNEYTFNAESYNPNIHSQYLRARYYDTVKGSFLTEDSYLGDIRNPLTLNRYSYCIGNPLFYRDPSGYDPTPVGITDGDAVEAYTISVIMEHQNEVNQVMDNVFNWLGESSGLYNKSTADQILSGFVAGVAGSYYDTWNSITSPEYILASLDYALRHPMQTGIGVLQSFFGGSDKAAKIYQDIKAENYRAAAQKVGYEVGKLSQIVLVKAAIDKCGDLISERKAKDYQYPVIPEKKYLPYTDELPPTVQSRINLANGTTRFTPLRETGQPVSAGFNHIVNQHFNRPLANSRSVFSVTQDQLKSILQSPQVVNSPVSVGGNGIFVRTADTGQIIGNTALKFGGTETSWIQVFTDRSGNIITAYPIPRP